MRWIRAFVSGVGFAFVRFGLQYCCFLTFYIETIVVILLLMTQLTNVYWCYCLSVSIDLFTSASRVVLERIDRPTRVEQVLLNTVESSR